jgi:hypothetical protein
MITLVMRVDEFWRECPVGWWENVEGIFCSPRLVPSKNERAQPDFRGRSQIFTPLTPIGVLLGAT